MVFGLIRKLILGAVLPAALVCLAAGSCTSLGLGRRSGSSGSEQDVGFFPQLGHAFYVSSVAYSPDGRYMVSGSADTNVKVWEISSGREIRTMTDHTSVVKSVAWNPDGSSIASGSADNTIIIWDAKTGKVLRTLSGHGSAVNSLAYSPDGKLLVSGSSDQTIKIWDLEEGREQRTLLGHSQWVRSVAWSPDGRYIASGSRDTSLKIWDADSGRELRTLSGHTGEVSAVAWSSNSRSVASGSYDTTVKIWDAMNGRELRTFSGHTEVVKTVSFSPDGWHVASGSSIDATLRVWELKNGREVRTIESVGIETVSYSPDGRFIAGGGYDNTIRIWDAASDREIRKLAGWSSWKRTLTYSPDGRYIVAGSSDRIIRLWDAETGRQLRSFAGHTASVRSVAYSPDALFIASGSADTTVRIWDADSGQELRTLAEHESVVKAVAYSPDGLSLVSGSADGVIKLWTPGSDVSLQTLNGHNAGVNALAYNPNGLSFASGSADNTIKLWDAMSGREIRVLRGHTSWVISLAYSPNGLYIASGSMDRTVRIWDAETGQELHVFPGHSGSVISSLAFSPDSSVIATGEEDRTIRIWDFQDGTEAWSLSGHTGEVYSVAYSPDGRHIASASLDGTTRIWDVATGREIAQFVGFINGEWISITPDGFFNASFKGDESFNLRVDSSVFGIDRYHSLFFRPEIVRTRLSGGSSLITRGQNITTTMSPPLITILAPEDRSSLSGGTVEMWVLIEDRHIPLKNIRIYLNDRLLGNELLSGIVGTGFFAEATQLGVPKNTKEAGLVMPLPLDTGINRIEVSAFNGVAEGLASVTVKNPTPAAEKALPNLRILSIGVSRYDEPRINHMGYPVFDAREILNSFKAQEGKQYGTVTSLLLATGEPRSPTGDTITHVLETFFKGVTSQDTVILFLSGHGVTDPGGKYYFLPSDIRLNKKGLIPFSEALSLEAINAALDVPGRKLVFIDSSHTEGIAAGGIGRVDTTRLALDLKTHHPLVFTSSRGDEFSAESAEYKFGLFTYAILRGLRGTADSDLDGVITMRELENFVIDLVPKLTNGTQHPVLNPDGRWYTDFPLVMLK